MATNKTEKYNYFQGFSKSAIKYNETKGEWKKYLYANKITYAICNETNGNYPFGLYNWYIINDTCKEGGQEVQMLPLTFSSCSDSEFVCNDGGWYALQT